MILTAVSAALLALAVQLPGQAGVVRGEIRSEETGEVIAGATVEVVGSHPLLASASDAAGRYTLLEVPAGRRTLRARRVGYAPFELDVVVPPGREVEIDISLRMTPIVLAPVEVGGRARSASGDTVAAAAGELTRAGVRALQSS